MINQELLDLFFWHYHPENLGSFKRSLLDAWVKADFENRLRLSDAFPETAEAIAQYQENPSILDQFKTGGPNQ